MPLLVTCWLTFAGLCWWAASLQRHERPLLARVLTPTDRRSIRLVGAALLIFAPWPWMFAFDPAMALTAWAMCVLPTIGAVTVSGLAFTPRTARALSALALLPRRDRSGS